MSNFWFKALILTGGLALMGCEPDQGPAEKAGENVDKAMEKTGEAVDDAVKWTGEKIEEGGDKVRESTQ